MPRYYDSFDPGPIPWVPGEERNIEEVFKNYNYFAIEEDGELLKVTAYQQGQPASVRHYRVGTDGGLQEVADPAGPATAATLYRQHCASCHSGDRLGASGPALLPANLGRLKRSEAAEVISNGRMATQMPGFAAMLNSARIDALVDFIYSDVTDLPDWDAARISASRQVLHAPGSLPDKPVFTADPLNLFLVVEAGDHHVTVLDGDRLEPIHRFATRFALHA